MQSRQQATEAQIALQQEKAKTANLIERQLKDAMKNRNSKNDNK